MKSHKEKALSFLLLIALTSSSYGQSPTELQCYAVEGGYSAVGEESGLITIDLVAGTVSWRDRLFADVEAYGAAVYNIDEFKMGRPVGDGFDQNWIIALEKLNMSLLAINRQSGELAFTRFTLNQRGDEKEARLVIQNSKHRCEARKNLF